MHMATTMFPLKAATPDKGQTLPHHLWPKSVLHDVYALRTRTKALRRLAAEAARTEREADGKANNTRLMAYCSITRLICAGE